MQEQLSRRDFLKSGGVAALAAAAGCDTQSDSTAPLLAAGNGSQDLELGDWTLAMRDTLSDIDVTEGMPTVGVVTATGDIGVWNLEAGMSTNAAGAEIVVEQTLSDVKVDRFPTIALLTKSGEMAVFTEDTYNG
jgi:hypothetical protein